MAVPEQLKILKEGVAAWNAWRRGTLVWQPDISGADLSFAQLGGAHLQESILRSTDLRGANLSRAHLQRSILRNADLRSADLFGANLIRADLRDADLRKANLSNVYLDEAELGGANLSGAVLGTPRRLRSDGTLSELVLDTALISIDLKTTKGLGRVNHSGAVHVSNTTLASSQGKIPDSFLRGCGLSDWEISAAKLHDPDLTTEEVIDLTYEIARIKAESPINVSPIFISYSHENADFVNKLEPHFDKKRIRYWRDIHHATSGPLEEVVDRAMRINSIVLLILSEHSVASDWVEWEVEKARELAKERKEHVLCPIALDDSWKTCRWPARLRRQVKEYNILDFSKWRDSDALGAAFQRLIDGLGIFYPKAG